MLDLFRTSAMLLTILFTIPLTLGIPLSLSVNCKQGRELSTETRQLCCERFHLHCSEGLGKVSHVSDVKFKAEASVNSKTRRLKAPYRGIPIRIHNMGEGCNLSVDKCAVGLHCQRGVCVRTPSAKHLASLIERGEIVEEEERALDNLKTADKERDEVAPEGLIVKGQAFTADGKEDCDRDGCHKVPRVTPKPVKRFSTSGSLSVTRGEQEEEEEEEEEEDVENVLEEEAAADISKGLGEEEDELTENVSEVLTSRLGISLDSEEKHTIRKVIAGTLDERAQREDQVAENGDGMVSSGEDTDDSRGRIENVRHETNKSNNANHGSFLEPLIQCAPDAPHRKAGHNEVSSHVAGRDGKFKKIDI